MDPTALVQLIALILSLSVASERLVEIVKGFVSYLSSENPDPVADGPRRACLQALAVVAGIVTASLATYVIKLPAPLDQLGNPQTVLGLGLLASGGSSFWNAILGYVTKIKDLKKTEVEIKKTQLDSCKAEFGAMKAQAEAMRAEAEARTA